MFLGRNRCTFSQEDLHGGSSTNCHDKELVRQLLRQTSLMNVKLDNIQQNVTRLIEKSNDTGTEALRDKDQTAEFLPLKSINDLRAFEDYLDDQEHYQQFCKFVTKIGGNHLSEIVQRVLLRTIQNDIACIFSWSGRRGKEPFENLKVTKGVVDGISAISIVKAKNSIKEVEVAIKNWLRHAPERERRAKNW